MEEAPKNGKESPHSVHANGLIDWHPGQPSMGMCVKVKEQVNQRIRDN